MGPCLLTSDKLILMDGVGVARLFWVVARWFLTGSSEKSTLFVIWLLCIALLVALYYTEEKCDMQWLVK